ncbi:MAG: hypothetical protein QW266_00155 [Sulfolobales archaeon]
MLWLKFGTRDSKNTKIGRQPAWVSYRLAREVAREAGPTVDGVFNNCTNFRTLEVIEVLERTTDPSSTQQCGVYMAKP